MGEEEIVSLGVKLQRECNDKARELHNKTGVDPQYIRGIWIYEKFAELQLTIESQALEIEDLKERLLHLEK